VFPDIGKPKQKRVDGGRARYYRLKQVAQDEEEGDTEELIPLLKIRWSLENNIDGTPQVNRANSFWLIGGGSAT
jgi:hypothetical protein